MTMRRAAAAALVFLLLLLAVAALGFRSATGVPVVREVDLPLRDYPAAARPIRLVLMADLHVHRLGNPPRRVAKIVDQINRLRPDLIVIAGDFVGGNWIRTSYSAQEAVAPLGRLRAPLGVYAVLGNHDSDVGEGKVAKALRDLGVKVLINEAVRVGPLALGGIDGRVLRTAKEWQARRDAFYVRLARTPGVKVLVAHRPDEANWAPPWVPLVLAGHTHCGQIVLPLIGALRTGSDFGDRYRCGVVREGPRVTIVTAGVGTSKVPIRIGAPPDVWLVTIRPPIGPAGSHRR